MAPTYLGVVTRRRAMSRSMPASAGGKLERMALNATRSAISIPMKRTSEPTVRAHCWSHAGCGGGGPMVSVACRIGMEAQQPSPAA